MEDNTETVIEKSRRIFTFISFFLILLGQILLYTTPIQDNVLLPDALWLCVAGIILLIGVHVYHPAKPVRFFLSRLPLNGPIPWITAAITFSILAVISMLAFQKFGRANYIPVLSFWLGGAACFVAGFLQEKSPWDFPSWLKVHRRELIQVGAIVLLAVLLRVYRLADTPRVLNGDEGWIGLVAQSTSTGELANPFALWENFGAIYLQLVNIFIQIFGPTPLALRIVPTLGGVLAIPALYLFARQIAGHRLALIASSLLAFSHTHINFSRGVAVGYTQATWLVPLELYFLLSGLEKRSSWRTATAGVLLAIHFSIYLTAQIVIALVLVYMVIAFLMFRSWFKAAARQALVFWAGLAIFILPEAVYIFRHPDQFFNRLSIDGTFQSGWLAREVVLLGQSAFQILAGRVIHAFMSLIYYPAIAFYGADIPMLSLVSSTLFLAGLAISLWRVRSPGFLLLNGYFWALTLSVGIFAIPPSADSYRMLVVLPPALLMAAIGMDQILDFLGLGWSQARTKYITISAITLFGLLVFNTSAYYFNFANQCKYGGDSATRFATYLGKTMGQVDPDSRIYLLSNEIFYYGPHLTVDYLSQRRAVQNVPEAIDSIGLISGDTLIANPDRIDELQLWARAHPGGDLVTQHDCQNRILSAYHVP